MKRERMKIGSVLLLSIVIVIAITMVIHVKSEKEKLENIQTDLIYVEAGRMTRQEAPYLSKEKNMWMYESSNSIVPDSAYLFAIPYIIIDVVLCILYIVKYRT